MQIIEHTIPYSSRSDEFTIHAIADIHHGAKASDTPRLERRLAEIDADPLALWVDLGDNCDNIGWHDPRFDFGALPRWLVEAHMDNPKLGLAQLQRDDLAARINRYDTLGDKLLGAVEGNHEAAIRRHQEIDVYLTLLEKIKPDASKHLALGMSGFLVLRFRRTLANSSGSTWTVVMYLHHGWGGGDLAGGVNLKLERLMDRYEADIYLLGHHHKVTTHTNTAPLRVNSALQVEQPPDKVGAVCGTYLRGVIQDADTYSEAKAYRPPPASADIMLKIRPDKHEIDLVERTVRDNKILIA